MANRWTEKQLKAIRTNGCNILVAAAAGSGKTAVLVERIIRKITAEDGTDVDRMVVVTFTKAAAAEMKQRIREALDAMLQENPGNERLIRQMTLIHNAPITTIDSFCLNIVRNYFTDIELDPGFRIADEGEMKLLENDVMEEMLEEYYASENQVFFDFVTYEMGLDTPVVVDKTVISQWVTADENYVVTFHPELIQEWVTKFAQQYDTAGKTRQFTTPDGRAAEVSGGTYGWEINEKAEYETLLANVESGETISREPVYVKGKTAASHGAQDWGSTYAEVDLTNQKMWYVKDGEVLMSADVVTGLPKGGRSTPAGVYTILERMQNKVLRGNLRPDGTREYETPVKYWMRVTYSGVGFHDATWQSSFGGNVYTYRGSHGCINMSYSDAGKLYELIQVGDPVIMHY